MRSQKLLMVLVIGSIAMPALGQPRIRNGQIDLPDSRKPSVYVRDSAVAAEKLALAQRMERLKEWNKSADVYQEIVEKYADRVVPADMPAEAAVEAAAGAQAVLRYTSVTLKVQSLLGKWPAEGLQVYRARYETPAQTLLDAADVDDVAALNRVVQLYFPTDAAKKAALRLMELYIEEGEFSAAAWLGERLIDMHPALAADEPNVLFRTVLAEHLAGNDNVAKSRAEQLKAHFADATGTVMGKDVKLAEEAEKVLASPAPVAHAGNSDSWPMLGGDTTRGRVPQANGRTGAKVAEVPLSGEKVRPQNDANARRSVDSYQRQRRDGGLSLGVVPIVDRGELFYQDNARIYAASVDSGLPLPGWATTYGGDGAANKRFADPQSLFSTSSQAAVTVTDNSVLAVLGQGSRNINAQFEGAPNISGPTQLLCVDRANGAKRWSISPAQFPEATGNLRNISFNGSPLVVGDSVYLSARGGGAMQFEDAYVICLSLADGRLRWSCYVASGNAPGENFGFPVTNGDPTSHLSYSGGRVYAVTNLGAVAAVDAYTGTIAWLTLYPKAPPAMNPMAFGAPQAGGANPLAMLRKPWAQNAAIVRDGKIFALPSDSPNLLILDAATGQELTRIALADYDNADTLLGVVGDKLLVSGRSSVYCINWPKFDPTKKKEENIFWWSRAVDPSASKEQAQDTIRGRGFVTTDSLFIATRGSLRRINLAKGIVAERYPANDAPWPAGEGPGNVVVTQDQVIVAGADNIVVYSDLSLARAKLDQSIADAPTDPLPRLKYAETLFAAGQTDDAIAKLDEAIGLLGGLNSMKPGAERDRVYARSLTFAERTADPKVGAVDVARVSALYDRAAAAANAAPQQVGWRFSRAKFARDRRDFETEVRLYQEVLSDPKLRGVNVPGDDRSSVVMASVIAEGAIKERLKSTPAAYAQFERAAKDLLAQATASKDANQMLAVAQTYPNATVASEAMFAAADAYETAGQHRPAVQTLNQLYRKYRDTADKARILEGQARNYLMIPGCVEVAIGRLNEGLHMNTSPRLTRALKLPDGTTLENVSFGAAAELLQKYSGDIETAALPEFNFPVWKGNFKPKSFLPETPEMVISDVDRLLMPPPELRKLSRYDRVVAWAANRGVMVYAVGTNKPLGSNSTIRKQPRGAIWVGSDLLIWTPQKLTMLKGDGAATAWEVDLTAVAPVEIASGEPDGKQPPQVVEGPINGPANAQRQVIVGPNGIIVDNQVIRLGNGGRLVLNGGQRVFIGPNGVAQRGPRAGGEEIDHVRPVGDRIVIATSEGRVIAVELATGQIAWQTRPTDTQFMQIAATDDFIAARYLDDQGAHIVALETFTGQVVYQKGFAADGAVMPINMTMSPDGTLLFTLPDRLCGIDLYEPNKGFKYGEKPNPEAGQVFIGAMRWDQLVVAEGRVLAVADNGQFVRVISVERGNELTAPLPTKSSNWNVGLRVVGPRMYVINQHSPLSYSLDHPDESWEGLANTENPTVRDAFVGKRHLVLLDQPDTPVGAEPAPTAAHYRLLAYARYLRTEGQRGESGRLDQTPDVTHPADIDQWQPVDGGFYYHSIDRQAHFLKGSATKG